ncbi:MAG: hypothetical protein QW726_06230, partial [Fervidicoccaceae archaeon]
ARMSNWEFVALAFVGALLGIAIYKYVPELIGKYSDLIYGIALLVITALIPDHKMVKDILGPAGAVLSAIGVFDAFLGGA